MDSKVYFIRSSALEGYQELAEQYGLNTYVMLRRAQINPTTLHDPDLLISSRSFVELLELSANMARCHDFGLRLSLNRGVKPLGAIGMLALNEASIENALRTIAKYLHIHNEGLRSATRILGDITQLSFTSEFGTPQSNRQIAELSLGVAIQFLRILMGETWYPIDVNFAHSAPSDTSLHRRIFRAPIYFDQEFDGLTLLTSEVKQPIQKVNEQMHKFLYKYVGLMDKRHGQDIVSRSRRIIRDLLSSGQCSKPLVAGYMFMNPRTLQRRLQEQGYTFKQLVEDVRANLAAQHLTNSQKSLTDLAEILGYSELSAFTRFFKRSFGMSPSKWRQEKLANKNQQEQKRV